ncbi:hypothetical protein PV516_19145 [Streptomyces scabiei]|uniref:hypothetical protein n=1 Tax=Streptomyces scabiei TaxID=1930 RepID=UPI0029B7FA14|nr:hypothetical protein [Streptomyces scabiei]MDX3165905.1 hypothetical protein [Streptomyces scabiei]
MARDIGMAPNAKVYRAVITKSYANGDVVTEYEGPYDKPGPARARVTFWKNHLANQGKGDKADGYVEQAQPAWEKAPDPSPRGRSKTSATADGEAPKDPVTLIREAMAQRRGMHGRHAADVLDQHGYTSEARRIRREVRVQKGHLSAKQAIQLLTATTTEDEDHA